MKNELKVKDVKKVFFEFPERDKRKGAIIDNLAKYSKLNMEENKPLQPTTTHQQDITKAGQRRVNLIWEFTQAIVAITITTSTVYAAINGIENNVLSNAFFLIVSMYFVRTNHKLIGGVGEKPAEQQR